MNAVKQLLRSMGHAWRGLLLAFRTERNFRIHAAAAVCVILICLLFPLRAWERAVLLLVTMIVLVLELFNSMAERLVELVKPRMHSYVRDIKDLLAASVFVASFFAAIVGILVVSPYLIQFFAHL